MNEKLGEYEVKDHRVSVVESSLPARQDSPNAVIMMAMQKGYDVTLIEKMMALQERYEANEARKAYHEAKAAFNENPPEVLKDKENSQFTRGDKKAMYVSLGNLLKTVNPALGKHGLSVSFEISQTDKLVTVSCRLSHRMGHSEVVTLSAPPDTSGGNAKNPIQQIKSTVTYLRAATFEAVTGLAATDEANLDDDGNGSDDKEPSKFEQWKIKASEVCEAAKKPEDIIPWWPANKEAVTKDLNKADAAKIRAMVVFRKQELEKSERQPGEEG